HIYERYWLGSLFIEDLLSPKQYRKHTEYMQLWGAGQPILNYFHNEEPAAVNTHVNFNLFTITLLQSLLKKIEFTMPPRTSYVLLLTPIKQQIILL
ncbi:hypothetical protein ACJX0J_014997, partial [Zea mays]